MEKLIRQYHLRPGDRIVTPRSGWGLIQHHAIYWGKDMAGNHWIIENQESFGVRMIELNEFLKGIIGIKRIEYFQGNDFDRRIALQRGEQLLGKPYDLLNFNCEHFANYLQSGRSYSDQIESFAGGLKAVAFAWLAIVALRAMARG